MKQATRRLVRDAILRLAVAVLLFDWIVVRWPTFVWLDLTAIGIAALAFQIDVESEDPKLPRAGACALRDRRRF